MYATSSKTEEIEELRYRYQSLFKDDNSPTFGLFEKKYGIKKYLISRFLSLETQKPRSSTILALRKAIDQYCTDFQKDKTPHFGEQKERSVLSSKEIRAITHSDETILVYFFITSSKKNTVTQKDIQEEFGRRGVYALDQLIKEGLVLVNQSFGYIYPRHDHSSIVIPHENIKIQMAHLRYFDYSNLGTVAGFANLNSSCSLEGIHKIREVLFKATYRISEVFKECPGNIPIYANFACNTYSKAKFIKESNKNKTLS